MQLSPLGIGSRKSLEGGGKDFSFLRAGGYNPGTLVTLVSGHMGDTLVERASLGESRNRDASARDCSDGRLS